MMIKRHFSLFGFLLVFVVGAMAQTPTTSTQLPVGTTAQRPSSPKTGEARWNTTTSAFEMWDGSAWISPSGGGSSPSVITPSQITADQDNYAPTGFDDATVVRISGDNGIRSIHGFSAQTEGEEKTIVNVGSYPVYFAPEHASTTAANRIASKEEIFIPPGDAARIMYDGTLSRWVVINSPSVGYYMSRGAHATFFDWAMSQSPTAVTASGAELALWGSIQAGHTAPTSSEPFSMLDMNSGSTTSGGAGVMFPRGTEEFAYIGSAHIASACTIYTPASLADGTNDYYFFFRIADTGQSGFWNQNNSFGLRYDYTVNSGKWEAYSRDNSGTDYTVDTGVTFSTSTKYDLLISINKANTEATFMINGVVVARITSNLPSATSASPSIQLEKQSGSSARSARISRFIAAAIAP